MIWLFTNALVVREGDRAVRMIGATVDITDKWSVTGGARWFEFDRENFDLYQVPLGLPVESDPDANGLLSKSTDSDTTFKFATRYQFSPDVMAYALYS